MDTVGKEKNNVLQLIMSIKSLYPHKNRFWLVLWKYRGLLDGFFFGWHSRLPFSCVPVKFYTRFRLCVHNYCLCVSIL